MSDRFKEAMTVIGASALMAVLVTYGLLEGTGTSEGGYIVSFMIIWALIGVILSVVLGQFDIAITPFLPAVLRFNHWTNLTCIGG
jgi:hypothetical protein